MKKYTLFYSWQTDRGDTKRIINNTLKKVHDSLEEEGIDLYIDQDTRDRIGTVNINEKVISKIEACDIFVADLTPVITLPENKEKGSLQKHMPNSNVLYEYGYAQKAKGQSRIIALASLQPDEHIEYMPFDLNHDTITKFSTEDDLKHLGTWIRKIINDVDLERSKQVKEYECDVKFKGGFSELLIEPELKEVSYIAPTAHKEYNSKEAITKSILSGNMLESILDHLERPQAKINLYTKSTNMSFCPISFSFMNLGSMPLENCHIVIKAEADDILIENSNVKTQIGFPEIYRKDSRYINNNTIFYDSDVINPQTGFSIKDCYFHIPHGMSAFSIKWHMDSKYFNSEGELRVNVSPKLIPETRENNSKIGLIEYEDYIIYE